MILYLDLETYCETPLNNGTHIYAESAEVMIWAWAVDDGPVQVFDATDGALMPNELLTILCFQEWDGKPLEKIVGHNFGNFDRTVLRHNGCHIPVELIHDTMIQAMSHGLPGALEKLCAIFNVPIDLQKHKAGKQLIQLFCKPRPKNQKLRRATKHSHPVEWQRFLDYAGSDIHSMRYLYKQLPTWNYPTREHGLWCLDQKINDRGFKVDLDLARAAVGAVEAAKKIKDKETQALTDDRLRSTNQRDALLQELLLEYGVDLPDTQMSTIERRLEDPDLPEGAKELLAIRLMTSGTANAKYNRIIKAVSSDGRLRGSLQFCGAPRTKRWSGKVFQPQNLPRPDMAQEDIERGIEALKAGCAHLMFDDPIRLGWNAIRGLIIADEGRKLVQADLSGIEARVLPWLAGEEWKLDVFRKADAKEGPDVYCATASRILGRTITKEDPERQSHGKVVELACGYGGAAGAFAQFARLYKVDMPEHEVHETVRAWREAHPAIADWDDGLWAKLDRAARQAILHPGQTFEAGEHIRFVKWRNWLKMELPSGGFLSYASPKILPDPRRPGNDSISFMGINNYTRRWERIYTYGGKLSADATQSTAREILAHNLEHVEEEGYPIVLQVHDEVLTEPLDNLNHSVQDLIEKLTRRPEWIDDRLPLAAGGFEGYRYKKD